MSPDTRRRVERWLRRLGPVAGPVLLLPVVLVAGPLWMVSAVTRWLSRQPLLEPRPDPRPLVEFEPEVGARPRRNLDTYGRAQDVFRLTTDPEGWRGRRTLDEADVVVFGDSFAFGYGVDDAQFYADLDPDLSVKAVASPAYSMVHGLLWMRRLAPRLHGRTVVWFVFCGNDLADNLRPALGRSRMPFVRCTRGGSWEVVTDHVSEEPWTLDSRPGRSDELVAAFSTPSPYSDRVFAAAEFLIGEAAATCRAAAARLTVVSIPSTLQVKDPAALRALSPDPPSADLLLPDRRLGESCHSRGVPFVPLLPHLRPRHYWREDMHWNPSGHRLVARILGEVAAGRAIAHRDTGGRRVP